MSKVLAAASLTLTILILPSFWADIDQLVAVKLNYKPVLPIIEGIGDSLAIVLVISAFILFYFAFGREKKMKDTLQNLIKNRLKIRRRLRSKQVLSGD